jgi:hypothetical protein
MDKYTRQHPPTPWRETHDLSRFDADPDYKEPFDRSHWPTNGFIDDFIAHTYGRETTNFFAFWTAMVGLSGIIQRDAWLRFGEEGMFANFYTILVAEPAIAHKSTAMSLFNRVEAKAHEKLAICDFPLYCRKHNKVINGKATAEAMFDAMANRQYTDHDGTSQKTNANLILKVSELETLISRANYQNNLVGKLTDFYDCKDRDTDNTRGGGEKTIEKIFASLFACTTPTAITSGTIPPEAFGGGFMSRCIVVRQKPEDIHRIIPIPLVYPDCPDSEEMSKRLLWILENKQQEYALSPSGYAFYKEWYREEITELRRKAIHGETDSRDNRKTLQILKIAFMLKLQEYSIDRYVTEEHLEKAIAIYNFTNAQASELIEDVALSGQQDGRFYKLRTLIKKSHKIKRRELMTKHRYKKVELDNYLIDFKDRGEVKEEIQETGELTPAGKPKKEKYWIWLG